MTPNLEILNKLSTDNTITIFDPVCIRQKSNWSKIGKKSLIWIEMMKKNTAKNSNISYFPI